MVAIVLLNIINHVYCVDLIVEIMCSGSSQILLH